MKLTVATNFQQDLVDALRDYPVEELYGKLRQDAAGGGRSPHMLAPISRRELAEHVQYARDAGIGFNYLLNASCLGNREITRKGQRELESLLGWVCEIGASSVTVASPYLLRMVKTRYPHLRVRVSVFAGVDRVRKAQMWEELGADCIVLDSLLVNREFETLRRIRENVSCELELLANNSCLQGCALSPSHMNALAHSAQSWHQNSGFLIDYCFLRCTRMKLQEPVNYIRSEWIRPEDLVLYEDLGYERFKIVERDLPTPLLVERVKAYSQRRYEGNLLDLVQPYAFKDAPQDDRYYKRGWRWVQFVLKYVFRPSLVNPAQMLLLKRLAEVRGMVRPVEGEAPVYVDNRALDGFMERFQSKGCRDRSCTECGWCHQFAERAVRMDEERKGQALDAYEDLFEALEGGGMWRYGGAGSSKFACSSSNSGCGPCKSASQQEEITV